MTSGSTTEDNTDYGKQYKLQFLVKMEKGKVMYASPATGWARVSLESGICDSSIINPENWNDNVIALDHHINEGFSNNTFSNSGWDN